MTLVDRKLPSTDNPREPLAIVGIGCRFPGGVTDPASFWEFLTQGRSGIVDVPADRWSLERFYHENPSIPGRMNTRWGGFVDNLDQFDARFWGITPREAMRMDPQQRWLLEVAWEAIEDAGTAPCTLRGQRVGVFVGIATHDYSGIQGQSFKETDAHTNSGSTLSIASNRISYLLDLKGPSLSVDTACSSSLVALSIACRSIWAGECDSALCGGVNLMCAPHATLGFAKASMLSPDGQCFAFDERANGYVRGEGAGVVYFKRLSRAIADRDPIYAVIKAAVMNQDGHTSSMTVPGADAQAAMLRQAYMEAGIPPGRVVYMEAHGTGTPVGDPIEASALGRVLSQGRGEDDRCLLGSVKSNIGHLEAGSGIAGLIKAALVLHHGMVPPNANFRKPSPYIPFDELKLEVVEQLRPLPRQNGCLPVAAVNSFGFGGTNSHAVLEAAPPLAAPDESRTETADRPVVLPISARDPVALRQATTSMRDFLRQSDARLEDICASAGRAKDQHDERLVARGASREELLDRLEMWLKPERSEDVQGVRTGRVAGGANSIRPSFVFTGQGAQWWGMGQELVRREPIVRKMLEEIDARIQRMGDYSLLEEMTRNESTSRIHETHIAQPAMFGLQVALAELWKSWGILPAKVVGHSVGEVAAAYVAGVYDLEDAVKIIFHRSRLQHTTVGQGKMMAVGVSSREARRLIGGDAARIQIAAINSSNLVTLAGDEPPLRELAARLEKAGTFFRWLPVDYPFHTHLMDPLKAELLDVLCDIRPRNSEIPFISTVTGGVFQTDTMDAAYWWSNVRNPVLFAPAIQQMVRAGDDTFLEIGPHPALKGSVNECLSDQGRKGIVFHSLRRQEPETEELLANLSEMHIHGVDGIDWNSVNQSNGRLVRLPRYPWNRERFWLEDYDAGRFRIGNSTHPLLGMRLTAAQPTWEFDLDPRLFTYLESHRFWGTILFPAAGYGEIALALARAVYPDVEYTVEDLLVKKALFINENDVPSVRVEFRPLDKSFTISSATGKREEWDLHVTGRLTLLDAETPAAIDLDALKRRLENHIPHEEYYRALDAAGYHFGPHFKLIKNVWHTVGEALIEVPLPTGDIAPEPGHHFHPILLDACLQVGKAAIDAPDGSPATRELFLPRKLGRIRFYATEVPPRFWAHGIQRFRGDDHLLFDIYVYDDAGNRVCDILGFKTEMMEHIRDGNDAENCLYRYQWEACATNEGTSPVAPPADPPSAANYLVLADAGGFADRLIDSLRSAGHQVTRVVAGTAFQRTGPDNYVVHVDQEADLAQVLREMNEVDIVIHAWSLDHRPAAELSPEAFRWAQRTGPLLGMKLTHLLANREAARIHVLTRDAQSVLPDDRLSRVVSTPLMGMARVAFNEQPNLVWRMIDLPAQATPGEIAWVLDELRRDDHEQEVALRQGQRYARRVSRVRATDLPRRLEEAVLPNGEVLPYQLQIETPGILSNLQLHRTTRRAPGPDEVEAKVMAAGINFRNVMKALGMPIGNTEVFSGFGEDFSGTVLRVGSNVRHLKPGDEVVGLGAYSFRSYVTTHSKGLFLKPKHLSFADAATLPTVFLTANYSLRRLANLQRGEKVLIHAGTGGVGQAAIQISKDMGLEIFATAGSEEKRQLCRSLGAHHVMNSRTLDFADEIREVTKGYGVDAVLNSLAGDFIPKSLSILAPFGRFVEIGKVDIFNNTQIGMELLRNNISYFVFDLIEYIVQRGPQVAEMFVELERKFTEGVYQPLQHNDFPITKVEEAYRYMAQGKHVGKNVLTFQDPSIPIGTRTEDGGLFRPDGCYLITGGASGFGLEFAKWMARQGAGELLLMSRSGPADDKARATIDEIKDLGVSVIDARGDVTELADVQRVVAEHAEQVKSEPQRHFPLRGVVHGAMVLNDAFLAELDDAGFDKVLRPKMDGAWNLHLATRDCPLEHFMCFSSFSAVIGAPKQANYNAGNIFLDALAQFRQAQGLPALTFNWGAISGAGFVARNEKTAQYLDAIGMRSFNVDECLKVVRRMLQHEASQILASRADWQLWRKAIPLVGHSAMFATVAHEQGEDAAGGSIGPRIQAAAPEERAALVEGFIAENLAAVCSIDVNGIDFDTPLTSLGLDSLMAVELMNRIEGDLGLSVPMGKVLAGPTIRELAAMMLQMLIGEAEGGEGSGATSETSVGALTPLVAQPRGREFPLSQRQLAIWRSSATTSAPSLGPSRLFTVLRPGYSVAHVSRAIEVAIRNHPMLRASFAEYAGEVVQRLNARPAIQQHDARQLSASAYSSLLSSIRESVVDPRQGPNVRFDLILRGDQELVLVSHAHPLIADQASLQILLDAILVGCEELARGEEPKIEPPTFGYHDFVAWEQGVLKGEAGRKRFEYWRNQWVGAPAELRWPTSGNTTAGKKSASTIAPSEFRFELNHSLSQQLLAMAAEQHTSLRKWLCAAFEVWLHQRCGQSDFLLGTTLSGRQHSELRRTIGQFEHPVAIRCRLDGDPTFLEILSRVGQTLDEASSYQDYPLAELRQRHTVVAATGGQLSREFDPEAIFEMPSENSQDPDGIAPLLLGAERHRVSRAGQELTALPGDMPAISHGVALRLAESGGCVYGCWQIQSPALGLGTAESSHQSFTRLLEILADHSTEPMSKISTLFAEGPAFEMWVDATKATSTLQLRTRATDEALDLDPVREALLDPSILPLADKSWDFNRREHIFVTGSTGFVGAHLLDNLLRRTEAQIHCLVRGEDEAAGMQKIVRNLRKYGLELGKRASRVHVVVGDLSLPLLGLTEKRFLQLAERIDVIYHNGADINLALDYPALRPVNVRGTHEVLRLALTKRLKPTHLVSSYAVHASRENRPGAWISEADPLPRFETLANGYSRTKWIVEQMVAQARRLGLPVSVYRPGNITGHSVSGASNTGDIMHTLVMAIMHVGAVPNVDLTIDLTPVDFVAGAIVELSLKRDALGSTYNLLNPEPLQVTRMASWLSTTDFSVDLVPLGEWREGLASLIDSIPGEVLGVMSEIMSPDAGSGVQSDVIPAAFQTRFDCARTTAALDGTGIVCHPVDDRLLGRYMEYLEGVGFFDLLRQPAGT